MKKSIAGFCIAAAACVCCGSAGAANLGKELSKKFLPAASDMLTFTTISQKLHEMDVDADVAWTKLAGRAEYDAYRKAMHAKMMAAMGEDTAIPTELIPRCPHCGGVFEEPAVKTIEEPEA